MNCRGRDRARADRRSDAEIDTGRCSSRTRRRPGTAFQIALDIPEAARRRRARCATRRRRPHGARDHAVARARVAGANAPAGEVRRRRASWARRSISARSSPTMTGRLIVLGGHGKSAALRRQPRHHLRQQRRLARRRLGRAGDRRRSRSTGATLPVVPAWVVVAPPNYGPQRKSVRTMWDLMRDVAIQAGTLPRPARPSFTRRHPADLRAPGRAAMGQRRLRGRLRLGRRWSISPRPRRSRGSATTARPGPSMRRAIANQFRTLRRSIPGRRCPGRGSTAMR